MDTSPLLPRTNIPIAVKQLFGKAIGNVTLVFVLLPHCLIEVQWGLSNDIRTVTGTTISLPISFSNSAYIGLVTICRRNSLSQGVLSSYISNLTTTNFYLYFDKTGDNTTNKIYWFVIGK